MSKAISLRPYQNDSVEGLRAGVRAGHRAQVLMAPTGAGKTIIGAHLMNEVNQKGRRAAFIVDRVNLVDQTSAVLDDYGIPHGVVQAGHWRNRLYERIQICSAQTIEKRGFFPDLDLLVVDECFTPDVEILTERGFVRFDQLEVGLSVAQYDDGEIEFVKPTAYIDKPYVGPMVTMYSDRLCDLTMTPGHQLLLKTPTRWKKTAVAAAKFNSANKMAAAGRLVSSIGTTGLTVQEKFLIAMQADGSVHNRPTDTSKAALFTFCKQRKIDRFLALMLAGQFSYSEVATVGEGRRRFLVHGLESNSKAIADHFRLSELDAEKAAAIIKEMVEWDGSKVSDTCWYFSSVDESAVDFYQAVALLAGYKTYKTVQVDDRSERFQNVHRLFIQIETAFIGTQALSRRTIDYDGRVYCVRVPSGNIVVRRNGKPLVIGNCHATRKAMAELIKNRPDLRVIGLSATPFTKGMGALYSNVVNVCTTNQLIEEGFLVPLQTYAARSLDMTGAKVVAGEWSDKEVEERGLKIVGDIVSEWIDKTHLHFGGPVKTIVFSATVAHGHELCRQFNEQGYNFQQISYMDGSDDERRALIEEFRKPDSTITGLVSCEVFTKGFDVPDILCGIGARPYRKSLSSHMQQRGRVMRTSPGKTFGLWLDHCGNAMRFGKDEAEIYANGLHTLDDGALDAKVRKEPDEYEVKQMKCSCGFVLPPKATSCPACGKERVRLNLVENVAGIMEAVGEVHASAAKTPEYLKDKNSVWRQLCCLAVERRPRDHDKARSFALAQFRNIYGHWPKHEFSVSNLEAPTQQLKGKVQSLLIRRAHSAGKSNAV